MITFRFTLSRILAALTFLFVFIGSGILVQHVQAGAGGSYSCTGSIPTNASRHDAEEEEDLPSDLPWIHADPDTATKCEFACDTGYGWDGDSCEAAPSLTFIANPSNVENGLTTTLEWTVANATSCNASGDWSGSKTATDGTHQETTDPIIEEKTYILECIGLGGSVQQSIDVEMTLGGSQLYEYAITNTDFLGSAITSTAVGNSYCESEFGSDWDWLEFHEESGWDVFASSEDALYANSTTDRAWVWINNQNAECFSTGNSYGMTWDFHDPGYHPEIPAEITCNTDRGLTDPEYNPQDMGGGELKCNAYSGDTPCNKSRPLACVSVSGGATIPSQPADITFFTADPEGITVGASTDLIWNADDANICTLSGTDGLYDGNVGTASGGYSVSPEVSTTYTLTCYGAGGNDTAQTLVTTSTTCSDGIDNDNDGWTDLDDPGCDDIHDTGEGNHGMSSDVEEVTVLATIIPDFSLAKDKSGLQIEVGGSENLSDTLNVSVVSQDGFSDPVSLSIDVDPSLPDSITLEFDGDTTLTSGEYTTGADLTATITGNPGTQSLYNVTVTGNGDGLVRTTQCTLDLSAIVDIEDGPDSIDYSEF